MSEAEHLDIGSAQLKGINERVARGANVPIEPSNNSENDQSVPSVYRSSGEREQVYEFNVRRENNEDAGSVTNWDAGVCLGDNLNTIQSAGEGLNLLDNKVQACETDVMGNRISNCNAAHQPQDCFDPANAVSEQLHMHNDDSLTSELAENVTRVSMSGNGETLGKFLDPVVDGQLHKEGVQDYGPEKCSNGASTGKNDKIERLSPGKSDHPCVAVVDGNQFSSCDLMKNSRETISHTSCHENKICETSRLIQPVGVDSVESDLSDIYVGETNQFIPEPVIESLIPLENAVELRCKVNLLGESTNLAVDTSNLAQPGSCDQRFRSNQGIGDQVEDGFGHVVSCNQPVEENVSTQFQNNSTAEGNIVEILPENNHGSQGVDDLPSKSVQTSVVVVECISPVRDSNSLKHDKTPETLWKGTDGNHNGELSGQKAETASGVTPDDMKAEQTAEYKVGVIESSPTDVTQRSVVEVENSHHGVPESSCGIEKNKPAASDVKECYDEHAGPLSEKTTEYLHVVVLGCPAGGTDTSKRGRKLGKISAVSTGKKYLHGSVGDSTRALRPRSRHNSEVPEPSSNIENKSSITGKRRGRRKKTEIEGKSYDEFLRIRKHLRYLLHRIHYEQNLLDAYSSEGWRGQSVEKLKPEKELQRAKDDINRSKLKIRVLFQNLDSLSAEGRFSDSMFDSEGLIDSEDIFCAKCVSQEVSADNDIILCDGACDRGFHQFCLEPPLRTEEVPPGDEGWLCPACDCKVDCMDLLNDSQGTKLSVGDSWEKVFPEVVASLAGNEQGDILGLPSDDSEDNDYNPDGADDVAKAAVSGSSSDGSGSTESDSSDFSSVSEDLGAVGAGEQHLGLPSDDSEDDDYDPDGANVNQEDVERESSSSDFTSASEDLGAAVHNDRISGDDEPPAPLLGPDQDTADSPPVVGRRHVERLDYKKLYNDTYANAPSDSSDDDEEWTDMVSACKRKGSTGKGFSDSSIGKALASADGSCSAGAPRRRGRKKLNLQSANDSPALLVKSSEKVSVSGKGSGKPQNRLGEAVTQRLYESFKENKFPDRNMKETLAKELGITAKRVDKWFGNARWSANHHPGRLEANKSVVASHSTPPNIASNEVDNASGGARSALSGSLDVKEESGKSKSRPNTSRKRKITEECQPIPQGLNTETPKEAAENDSFETPQAETGTMQTPVAQHGSRQRRRKSSA